MHDPYSLVFDFGFGAIWHRDKNGADGACGWCYPRLSEKQAKAMKDLGFWEGKERHFLRYPGKVNQASITDRETLYRALLLLIARMLRIKLTVEEATLIAAEKNSVGGVDGMDRMFCFEPGWHTNRREDNEEDRREYWTGVCHGIARGLLRRKRRWYQHPRWHFWHWRISIPALNRRFGWDPLK